jgi:hypothetical protein
LILKTAFLCAVVGPLFAAEWPYFITYSHQMEEPGSLEISSFNVVGRPSSSNSFAASLLEVEYGIKAWWTTEVYLAGQTTAGQSTLFTGWRWENRIRPLMGEHWINPVLYVEFEDLNGADKTLKEVVGFDSQFDQSEPNDIARRERKHEFETKLLLSSNFRGWNASENMIAEKNLGNEPWEFGYALGAARPLRLKASPYECNLCWENLSAGIEMYGGLGTRHDFTLAGTSHYIAPTVALELPSGTTFRVSPGFGVTGPSHPFLLRFAVSWEAPAFGRRVREWLR